MPVRLESACSWNKNPVVGMRMLSVVTSVHCPLPTRIASANLVNLFFFFFSFPEYSLFTISSYERGGFTSLTIRHSLGRFENGARGKKLLVSYQNVRHMPIN